MDSTRPYFFTLVEETKQKGEYENAKHSSCEVGKARKDKVTKPLVHSRGQLYDPPNMDRLQYQRTQSKMNGFKQSMCVVWTKSKASV